MSMAGVLERRPEGLRTQMSRMSADVALRRDGSVQVGINPQILKPLVQAICAGLLQMSESQTALTEFPWQVSETDLYGSDYVQEMGLRAPEDNKRGERKYTFHYTRHTFDATNLQARASYRAFLNAWSELEKLCREATVALAERIDTVNRQQQDPNLRFPGSMADKLVRGTFVGRGLVYLEQDQLAQEANLPDAAPHLDRSGVTDHIYASAEGLAVYAPDGSRHGVDETSYSSIALFGGEKFAAMTRGTWGLGTPHGVRDKRRQSGTRTSNRYAIVGFCHPIADPGDVAWLAENRGRITAYERSCVL